ncbi:hypothetical protein BOFE_09150 (plasmid) [Candidatus Borrelia fainii]|uniref:Uncharacterized protein n=1 Tax=Candidatus Borrelia fainii TaxID=2518322 RepID=A0ABM8DLH8_9SPIR|nr:hypothetical protein [Candidatus Borrelia fainii]BDU63375.1 hypothetical protein BOFE_09150 [Candidatus Borrelia fainii]
MSRKIIILLAFMLFFCVQGYFTSLKAVLQDRNSNLQNDQEERSKVFKDKFEYIPLKKVESDVFKNLKNERPKVIIDELKLPVVSFDVAKLSSPFDNLDIDFSFFKVNFTHDVQDGQIKSGSQKNQVVGKIKNAKLKSISLLVTDPVKKILGTDYFPDILNEMKKRGFQPRHLLIILLGFRTNIGEEINVEMNFDHLSILEQALEQKNKMIHIGDKNFYALKLNFVTKSENYDKLFLPGEVKYDSSDDKVIFRNEGEQDYTQNDSTVIQKVEVIKISAGYFNVLKNLITVNQLKDFLDENKEAILRFVK